MAAAEVAFTADILLDSSRSFSAQCAITLFLPFLFIVVVVVVVVRREPVRAVEFVVRSLARSYALLRVAIPAMVLRAYAFPWPISSLSLCLSISVARLIRTCQPERVHPTVQVRLSAHRRRRACTYVSLCRRACAHVSRTSLPVVFHAAG